MARWRTLDLSNHSATIARMKHNGKVLDLVELPRVVEIDRLLTRQRGVTVEQLVDKLGVCAKTIRRDMDVLRRLYGRRLKIDVGPHGRKAYRIDAKDRIFARWVAGRVENLR